MGLLTSSYLFLLSRYDDGFPKLGMTGRTRGVYRLIPNWLSCIFSLHGSLQLRLRLRFHTGEPHDEDPNIKLCLTPLEVTSSLLETSSASTKPLLGAVKLRLSKERSLNRSRRFGL